MKINWKDFGLMYLIGIVSLLVAAALMIFFGIYNPSLGLLVVPVVFLLPGLFFFYRNVYEIKDALIISALFGFTFIPVYFIALVVPLAILETLVFQPPNSTFLIPGVNWTMLLVELIVVGIILTISATLSYFISKYLLSKPPKEKPQDSKPKPSVK